MKSLHNAGEKCPCRDRFSGDMELLGAFERIRSGCPALRLIMIPDNLWEKFRNLDKQPWDQKAHRSILLLAYERGHLAGITAPVHRFLLEDECIAECVNRKYLKNYWETWMQKPDILERHRQSRLYLGFMHELLIAETLHLNSWEIKNLAAWGGKHDIEATGTGGRQHAFEVKFIGEDDASFIRGGGAFGLEKCSDYLMLRVYEAARQLQNAEQSKRMVAVIIIGVITKDFFKMAFERNIVPWHCPKFYHREDDWKRFFRCKVLKDYPDIEKELADCIRSIDHVWILMEGEDFTYESEFAVSVGLPI